MHLLAIMSIFCFGIKETSEIADRATAADRSKAVIFQKIVQLLQIDTKAVIFQRLVQLLKIDTKAVIFQKLVQLLRIDTKSVTFQNFQKYVP